MNRRLLTVLGVVLLFLPIAAFGQDVVVVADPDTGFNWLDTASTWADALWPIFVTVILPFVAIWIKQKTGVDVEKVLRDGFQTSAHNAAGWLVLMMGERAARAGGLDPEDPLVKRAIEMVKGGAKDAIDKFSISNDAIIKRIEAKVGIITGLTDDSGKPLAPAEALPRASSIPAGVR